MPCQSRSKKLLSWVLVVIWRCSRRPCPLLQLCALCQSERLASGSSKKSCKSSYNWGWFFLAIEPVVAAQAPQARTEEALGMHGIRRDNAILHVDRLQPAFDRTDLIL